MPLLLWIHPAGCRARPRALKHAIIIEETSVLLSGSSRRNGHGVILRRSGSRESIVLIDQTIVISVPSWQPTPDRMNLNTGAT